MDNALSRRARWACVSSFPTLTVGKEETETQAQRARARRDKTTRDACAGFLLEIVSSHSAFRRSALDRARVDKVSESNIRNKMKKKRFKKYKY